MITEKPKNTLDLAFTILSVFTRPEGGQWRTVKRDEFDSSLLEIVKTNALKNIGTKIIITSISDQVFRWLEAIALSQPWLLNYLYIVEGDG